MGYMDRICGIPVHSWPYEKILAEMERNIETVRENKCISITNTESMYHACRILEHRDYIENADLEQKFPGMITAGTFCPSFGEIMPDEEELIRQVNDSRPGILWVGLGLLKQEAWIRQYKDRLDVPWMIGVGAAFDYHTGGARWAPGWIRSIGFEWLYRLYFEPRMFKRNVWSFIFLFEATLEGILDKLPIIGRKKVKICCLPAPYYP